MSQVFYAHYLIKVLEQLHTLQYLYLYLIDEKVKSRG